MEFLVMETLKSFNNSSSSPEGISFKLLKAVMLRIIRPLDIIYQQSLNQGIFPRIWKLAVVIPLYKGRSGRSCVSIYRPVSLCSCLGKFLDKIVHTQLLSFLRGNELLHCGQHGFTPGKSTLTNMLIFDAYIANFQLLKHPYDIMSSDFKKAFEKVPHQKFISELAVKGIIGRALEWFSSFLSEGTHQVRVGIHLSSIKEDTSGVVEGSFLGPDLYNVVADSLVRRIKLPRVAYADDFKFISDAALCSQAEIQIEINMVTDWSEEYHMPFPLDECSVMHFSLHQPLHNYVLNSCIMKSVDTLPDLGVTRTSDGGYSGHCDAVSERRLG